MLDHGQARSSEVPTIKEALELYLSLKGEGRSDTFFTGARRNTKYIVDCLGSRHIDQYTTADGGKFRDWLVDKGMTKASVVRVFSSVKAIMNLVIHEHGLNVRNPFAGVYLSSKLGPVKRIPISATNVKKVQAECKRMNDDLRWLVALISDSGMRLSEATGLHLDDLVLDSGVPHVIVQPHEWRSLKTTSSRRVIPLVGASLWAARVIKKHLSDGPCFPRYTSPDRCNSNSASAALNKWMQQLVGRDNVLHGFRHSFRDRLRAIEAPADLIDQVGGWSSQSVGQGYGDGYPLGVIASVMKKMT